MKLKIADRLRPIALTLVIFGLAGCAPAAAVPPGDYPDLTLAESKSPAQLLRNVASGRVSRVLVNNVDAQTDRSVACRTADEDPTGIVRRWESTADIALQEWKARNAGSIADDLVAAFAKDGWASAGSTLDGATLTKPATASVLSVLADPSAGVIHVVVTGPCVLTNGAQSDEVTALESAE